MLFVLSVLVQMVQDMLSEYTLQKGTTQYTVLIQCMFWGYV